MLIYVKSCDPVFFRMIWWMSVNGVCRLQLAGERAAASIPEMYLLVLGFKQPSPAKCIRYFVEVLVHIYNIYILIYILGCVVATTAAVRHDGGLCHSSRGVRARFASL